MLRAEGIVRRHAGATVLGGVDLAIAPNEVAGLSGPSGSGKTTLARILAGAILPERGRVTLDGRPLPRRGPSPVQVAPQAAELAVDPLWTVRRILRNGGEPDPALVEALGIRASWAERRPGELSGGERQRVAVARLMLPSTRYLVADEITASLDALAQADLWDRLLAFTRARGIGVLVISHDRTLLEGLCDRIHVLAALQPEAA